MTDQTVLLTSIQKVSEGRISQEEIPLLMSYAKRRELKKGEAILRE